MIEIRALAHLNYDDLQRLVTGYTSEAKYWVSKWVWELHVAENHKRRGIGQQMIEALVEKARAAGLRTVVCETQNTNVPAIHFYRKMWHRPNRVTL